MEEFTEGQGYFSYPGACFETRFDGVVNSKVVNEIYNVFVPSATDVIWFNLVWNNVSLPRISFISWLIMHGRLPTQDWLVKFHLLTNNLCVLCKISPESHDHLFASCPFTRRVLGCILRATGVRFVGNSLTDWVRFFNSSNAQGSVVFRVRAAALCCAFSGIWFARNNVAFKKQVPVLQVVCKGVALDLAMMINLKCKKPTNRFVRYVLANLAKV